MTDTSSVDESGNAEMRSERSSALETVHARYRVETDAIDTFDIPLNAPMIPGDRPGRWIAGFEGWRDRVGLPTVVLLPEDGFGVGTLRMFLPGREVHRAGLANVFLSNSYSTDVVDTADLLVFQRTMRPGHVACMDYAKACGKAVALDADDNLLHLPSQVRKRLSRENGADPVATFERALFRTDVLTVSVPDLQNTYKHLHRHIYICENRIDFPRRGRPPMPQHNKIIGFAGSGASDDDWGPAGKALTQIMRRDPKVQVVMAGRDYRATFGKDVCERIQTREWRKYSCFRSLYADFDIAIAPLIDSKFSRSKSCLKLLDYSVFSIPVIAGNVLPYKNYAVKGQAAMGGPVCRLAETVDEWEREITVLLENPDLAREMGENNGAFARTAYDTSACAEAWWPAWKMALEMGGKL